MSWNYRVLHEHTDDGEEILAIHEVYYNRKGEIKSISEEPAIIAAEDVTQLEWILESMADALKKDVLVRGEIKFYPDDDE